MRGQRPVPTYFTQQVPGVAARRYCLFHTERDRLGNEVAVVTATQMSVPDGVQVDPPPRHVRWAVAPRSA